MATNNLSSNSTTAATLKQNSDFCEQHPDALFQTLGIAGPYIVNAALNVISAIVAIVGNTMIFLAIRRSKSIHLPSKLLLFTLFMTDFGAGLIAQPLFAVLLIMKAQAIGVNCLLAKSLIFVAPVLSCVSLLTMTAITLDRYIAVLFHSKYHQIVTVRRVCAVLTVVGLLGIVNGSTRLLDQALFIRITLFPFLFCVFIISVADIKMYRWLRQQEKVHVLQKTQAQDQTQPAHARETPEYVTMYKRLASTMMWIYAVFIGCYAPYFCVRLITRHLPDSALKQCIREFFYTILLCNSSFNPFVYYVRLPGIREQVVRQFRDLCGCGPPPRYHAAILDVD